MRLLARPQSTASIRQSLASHRLEEQKLRNLIASSSSPTVRILAGIDLVEVAKKIESELEQIGELEVL